MANPSSSTISPVANSSGNLVDVEVEFDYDAELGDELTIRSGEIVKDVKRMSGGWWEGSLKGKRGLFPDNFVKVLSKDVAKTKQLLVGASGTEEAVQLRSSQKKQGITVAAKKRCRVLYSYQPKHEDELELKVDDIVEFESEVEDGWWKGNLRGKCGVFPSNFVELLRSSMAQSSTTTIMSSPIIADASKDENTIITVADKNKKNEKLKADKTSTSSSRISSLIQEAESKTPKKKSSENLNLIRRESPIGSENSETGNKSKISGGGSIGSTGSSNNILAESASAPKLPPKPGSPDVFHSQPTARETVQATKLGRCQNRFASPPPSTSVPNPNRRHSSALICATGDFFYYDKSHVDKYNEEKSSFSNTGTPKKGRFSQLFGKLGLEKSSSSTNNKVDNHRHSWTSALFRTRRKENKLTNSKTSFSKIDEESSTHVDASTQLQQQRVYTQSMSTMTKSRRRFKSKSERDLEGITHLCPVLGIRSIERGSQTESEAASFGVSSIWSGRFRRRKTISTQTLPTEFQDDEERAGFPSPCAVSVHEIYQTVFSGSNTSCCTNNNDNYYGYDVDPLYSEPMKFQGQMCQSSPAVVVESCSDLNQFDHRQDSFKVRRRNRIITNPRLFVQARIKSNV